MWDSSEHINYWCVFSLSQLQSYVHAHYLLWSSFIYKSVLKFTKVNFIHHITDEHESRQLVASSFCEIPTHIPHINYIISPTFLVRLELNLILIIYLICWSCTELVQRSKNKFVSVCMLVLHACSYPPLSCSISIRK